MSEFPRGWLFTNAIGGPTAATITVPGIANVVRVLDSFQAKLLNGGVVSVFAPNVGLSSSDGTLALTIACLMVPGTTGSVDEASSSGLDLAAGAGASLTIAFTTGVASVTEFLLIQGHDI